MTDATNLVTPFSEKAIKIRDQSPRIDFAFRLVRPREQRAALLSFQAELERRTPDDETWTTHLEGPADDVGGIRLALGQGTWDEMMRALTLLQSVADEWTQQGREETTHETQEGAGEHERDEARA